MNDWIRERNYVNLRLDKMANLVGMPAETSAIEPRVFKASKICQGTSHNILICQFYLLTLT
jgi:hypothetical protein